MVYLKDVVSLGLNENACTGCGRCAEVCPHAVFVMVSGHSRPDNRDSCMECGACARNCPAGAITVQTGVGCATGILDVILGGRAPSRCETPGSAHRNTAGYTSCRKRRTEQARRRECGHE